MPFSYNPGVQDRSAELKYGGISAAAQNIGRGLEKGLDARAQLREKQKQDQEIIKGFTALWNASPELQSMVPDPGVMSANGIHGLLRGLEARNNALSAERQSLQMQQIQEMMGHAATDRQQLGGMFGVPEGMSPEVAKISMAQNAQQTQFTPEQMGVAREIPGMEGSGFMFVPTSGGGGQIVQVPQAGQPMPQPGQQIPLEGQDGFLVYTGQRNGDGLPVWQIYKPHANIWQQLEDMEAARAAAAAALGGQQPGMAPAPAPTPNPRRWGGGQHAMPTPMDILSDMFGE